MDATSRRPCSLFSKKRQPLPHPFPSCRHLTCTYSLYYHFAILLLFRPFIRLRFLNSFISPRDVCAQSAESVSSLIRSYGQLYTLRRTPSFVPYIVLTAAVMHLVAAGLDGTASQSASPVQQAIDDLRDMSSCHRFAKRAINILRYLAGRWQVGIEMSDYNEETGEDSDRESLCRMEASSMNFFCPNPEGEPGGAIFAPFPTQGVPLIVSNSALAGEGFEMIGAKKE